GLDRRTTARRMPQILGFAEISEELIDTPVKRYSSGMMARLGFATITALDAAVMLIDEVLAVGDASFQRRCIQWLNDYKNGGGTLLFVSHKLSLVRNITGKVVCP